MLWREAVEDLIVALAEHRFAARDRAESFQRGGMILRDDDPIFGIERQAALCMQDRYVGRKPVRAKPRLVMDHIGVEAGFAQESNVPIKSAHPSGWAGVVVADVEDSRHG